MRCSHGSVLHRGQDGKAEVTVGDLVAIDGSGGVDQSSLGSIPGDFRVEVDCAKRRFLVELGSSQMGNDEETFLNDLTLVANLHGRLPKSFEDEGPGCFRQVVEFDDLLAGVNPIGSNTAVGAAELGFNLLEWREQGGFLVFGGGTVEGEVRGGMDGVVTRRDESALGESAGTI